MEEVEEAPRPQRSLVMESEVHRQLLSLPQLMAAMLVMVKQAAMAVVIEVMATMPFQAPSASLLPLFLQLVVEVTAIGELEPKTSRPRPRLFVVSASAETTMWAEIWACWMAFQVLWVI